MTRDSEARSARAPRRRGSAASRSRRPPLSREEPARSGFNRPATSRSRWKRCRVHDRPALDGHRRRRRRRWWRSLALGAAAVAAGVAIGVAGDATVARRARSGVVSFEARTFDRLPITNARFMPDGKTIVYSATPQRIVAGALRHQPHCRSAAIARAVECAPALGLEHRRARVDRGPALSSISASTAARWRA